THPRTENAMSEAHYRHCRPDLLLQSVGGDRNTFMLLVDIFRRDTAEKLTGMRAALMRGERAQLAFSAHALKGTVGPTGADNLLQQLVELETASRDPLAALSEQALDELERQVARIREELERFAAGLC
ncbi:MAG TPA: Hpt domain-containing protein, partial [Burkholderiaceae bacterium]